MQKVCVLLFALALAACERSEEVENVDTSVCAAGLMWAGGEEEDPRMHPGRDCIGCHAQEDEGPRFAFAGTVYGDWREADDCFGVAGVRVEVTDSLGAVLATLTNQAGNFYLESEEASLSFPYTVRLTYQGRERVMQTPQTVGACNGCHTAAGASGAPGRILAP